MTKKNLPAVHLIDRDDAPELPELSAELRIAFAEVADAARQGLLAMSVAVGLRVMSEMMEEEVTTKVGPKHAKLPGRTATRHAAAPGSVVLGGRRLKVQRPRARTTDNTEVHLDTYAAFADDDVLSTVVFERMLAGLATRRHRAAAEPVGSDIEATARSTSKSSVSRRFVAKTKKALDELMARDLSDLDVVALMLDGVNFAEHCCVVALAICGDGTKVPVGLWLGDTENKTVVTHLLADLVDRGLSAEGGLLVVIDGAKALAAGVRKVFGDAALIQRCTLHKRRNCVDHLPESERGWVDTRLGKAFNHADPAAGLHMARDLARQLETRWPRRRRQPAGRPRGDVHGASPWHRRPPGPHSHQHQPHRVDDLGGALHHRQREEVAGRHDGEAVGGGRDAQRRAELPPGEGLQGDAQAGRGPSASRRRCCHTPMRE